MIKKSIFLYLSAIILCLTFDSCQKKLTPEERKANLEAKISENDCKEFASKALHTILKDLRDIKYDDILLGVQENHYDFLNKDNNLYMQIIVSGHAQGIFNGKDSTYLFVFHGRIPEVLADNKEFDEDGYSLSLKSGDGFFIYDNKEDIDSLNNSIIETHKKVEEMAKKDFMIGKAKVRFEGKEGNSLKYKSTKELTPDEIADAVQNKIESEGANMIQFFYGSDKYADYVYKTQCIIFVKYPDKIYKIIGGRPTKI